jgi:hypothetical protein
VTDDHLSLGDHLSVDDIAELDEGLLPPERISAARAHLHGCAQCRARADAITATRTILAGLPAVEMPSHVIARLDRALDAEAEAVKAANAPRLRTVGGDGAVSADRTPVDTAARTPDVVPTPGSVSAPRFGRPSMAALAVAATFVLAAGAVVIGHFNHNGSDSASPAAATAGGVLGQVVETAPDRQPISVSITSTGKNYSQTTLAADVQDLLNQGTAPTPTTLASSQDSAGGQGAGTGAPTTDGKRSRGPGNGSGIQSGAGQASALAARPVPKALQGLFHSKRDILTCAATLTAPGVVPLTVDFARWTNPATDMHRVPAAAFVFKTPVAGRVAVYVIRPPCDGTFLTFSNVSVSP